MRGEDGKFNLGEMNLVKSALANSSLNSQNMGAIHSNKSGYGELNAEAWLEEISIEFNLTKLLSFFLYFLNRAYGSMKPYD